MKLVKWSCLLSVLLYSEQSRGQQAWWWDGHSASPWEGRLTGLRTCPWKVTAIGCPRSQVYGQPSEAVYFA